MRKYLSLIGVWLSILVGFNLMPQADAQDPYVSPALLLGVNFDYSGGSGLEVYPSLSPQVTINIVNGDGVVGTLAISRVGHIQTYLH